MVNSPHQANQVAHILPGMAASYGRLVWPPRIDASHSEILFYFSA
jgi:hypothetical protein